MAGLLWETGEPLSRLVCDAFRAMVFEADLTPPGATYDVTVALAHSRLLIEVTGIEGKITNLRHPKKSAKSSMPSNQKQNPRTGCALPLMPIAINRHRLATNCPLLPLTLLSY
jgi:hypothetical protein